MSSRKIVWCTIRKTANVQQKTSIPFRVFPETFSSYLLNIYLVLLLLYCTSNLNLSLSDFKQHLECCYMSHDVTSESGIQSIFLTCPFGILQGQGATREKEHLTSFKQNTKIRSSHVKVQEINTDHYYHIINNIMFCSPNSR